MRRGKRKHLSLPVQSLQIGSYQRPLAKAKVARIRRNLDLDALGTFVVSYRDGAYWCIDGQHRRAALIEEGMGEWEVDCDVRYGLSEAQEAGLYRKLNDQARPTASDDFRAALVQGEPDALRIEQIVSGFGLALTPVGGDGRITCVSKVRQLYVPKGDESAGAILGASIALAHDAWGLRYAAYEKSLLGGFATFLRTYGWEFERGALVKKLAKRDGGPSAIVGAARGLRDMRSGSMDLLVATVIVATYNKGRRRGQLAPL